jgi:hypothetical protein
MAPTDQGRIGRKSPRAHAEVKRETARRDRPPLLAQRVGFQVIGRFDSIDVIGATNIEPGNSYVEVNGARYWAPYRWISELSRLQARLSRTRSADH